MTLQEIYRARCRTHAAFHASPRHDPKATGVKQIIRKIKARLQQRIEYEHAKAENARRFSHEEGPMAAFQKHWVTRGAAIFTKAGPKVALLGPAQNREPPMKGGVHLRTAAVVYRARGREEGDLSRMASVSQRRRRRRRRDATATGRWEGADATVAALGSRALITFTFVRGGGEVVFKNTYESLSVDGRCVPITERTSLT